MTIPEEPQLTLPCGCTGGLDEMIADDGRYHCRRHQRKWAFVREPGRHYASGLYIGGKARLVEVSHQLEMVMEGGAE